MNDLTRPLAVDTYVSTRAFQSIGIHACVCFADDAGLVATTGRAEEPLNAAYARLFAAAPALLAALEELTEGAHLDGDGYVRLGQPGLGDHLLARARAAIAKATGAHP